MFGYDLEVRTARTLNAALDNVLARKPELVLLDDILKPSDTAAETIPFLRRANYDGPIVVISGQVDRHRRTELLAKGANDTIHKDDLNSVAIAEVIERLFSCQAGRHADEQGTEGRGQDLIARRGQP